MTAVADTAYAAHSHGLSVLPPREDGTKAPQSTAIPDDCQHEDCADKRRQSIRFGWIHWSHERPGLAQLAQWYPRCNGVGVVCGAVSGGLEMFEFEGRAVAEGVHTAFRELCNAAELGDLLDRIKAGYFEGSPSGGIHLLYRITSGVASESVKLAQRPARDDELTADERDTRTRHPDKVFTRPLIEVKGEGGYTIIAPTNGRVHPTGGAWTLAAGSVATIATITADERDELHRIAEMLHQPAEREGDTLREQMARDARRPTGGGDWKVRPGDDYNARGNPQARVRDLLEAHGWNKAYTKGDVDYMRRPGKKRGMSATLRDHGGFYCWSTATEFDEKTPYTPFAVYTLLEHGGDYKAAAKALHADGYGEPADDDTPPPPRPPPKLDVDPCTLEHAHKVFRDWLGDDYDLDTIDAVLATAAAERLGGDPLWLLIVSGPGNAKTETVQALSGVGAHVTSTITSEGALLSATPKRDKAKNATGGLLRAIGDRGLLVIKDVTSILSMSRETRSGVLAALREIHDGRWDRNVGVDGGRTLTWTGRLVIVGACTSAWDRAHDVISTMGDRFVLVRADSHEGRDKAGRQAIKNKGDEQRMRQDLAGALAAVLAGVDPDQPFDLTNDEETKLINAADLVTLARTSVQYDYRGDVVDADAPEMPTRFAKQLAQMMHGAIAIGLDREAAMRLAIRCARDSMPPLRLQILEDVAAHPGATATEVRKRLDKPRATVDRQLQSLHMLRVLTCSDEKDHRGTAWKYTVTEGYDPAVIVVPDLSVQGRRGEEKNEKGEHEPSRPPSDKSGTTPPRANSCLCPCHRGAGNHGSHPCPCT